jgi:putative hydrolase of HD superfamily
MKTKNLAAIANFIYEAGNLSKTPRSGLWLLGTGEQSVAEHSLRCAFIGYSLCYLAPKANRAQVVMMCLFHDLGESRTSDLNYLHQKYGRLAEAQAIDELSEVVPFGKDIKQVYDRLSDRKSLESQLAHDADQLE